MDKQLASLVLVQQRRIALLEEKLLLVSQYAPHFRLRDGRIEFHHNSNQSVDFLDVTRDTSVSRRQKSSGARVNTLHFGIYGAIVVTVKSPNACIDVFPDAWGLDVNRIYVTCDYALLMLEHLETLLDKIYISTEQKTYFATFFKDCKEELHKKL